MHQLFFLKGSSMPGTPAVLQVWLAGAGWRCAREGAPLPSRWLEAELYAFPSWAGSSANETAGNKGGHGRARNPAPFLSDFAVNPAWLSTGGLLLTMPERSVRFA
jgi:hypothetical protein